MIGFQEPVTIEDVKVSFGADLDDLYSKQRPKVMVVEDEADTVMLLKQILRTGGFDVFSAWNGKEALEKTALLTPDLVVLDLMMPEMDGMETFKNLRKVNDVPVIIVSAMNSKDTIVQCLKMGADDYLTKPFYKDEVVARVHAVLRRTGKRSEDARLTLPGIDLTLNFQTREVVYHGESIELTGKEFAVLAVLARNAPGVVHYQTISRSVWGRDFDRARQRIKYLIFLLRKKFLAIRPDTEVILNVDRLGYKLYSGE
jgi:DNA-binding response OmpR family regulator